MKNTGKNYLQGRGANTFLSTKQTGGPVSICLSICLDRLITTANILLRPVLTIIHSLWVWECQVGAAAMALTSL